MTQFRVFLLVVTCFFVLNGALFGAQVECLLDAPIQVNLEKVVESSPFHTHLLGKNIVLDEMPKFWDPENFNFSEDKLELRLFNICLLYTSPSPRDRTRSRMPSSA